MKFTCGKIEDGQQNIYSKLLVQAKISDEKDSEMHLLRNIGQDPSAVESTLTIVVCAYNHENYIEQCLQSINESIVQSIDLIVIDDGSPDNTLNKCLNFDFRKEIAVRLYSKANKGLVDSLSQGLKLAKGRYFAAIASDDCYVDGGIQSVLRHIEQAIVPIDALLCQAVTMGGSESSVYKDATKQYFEGTPFERLEKIWTEPPNPMLLQATVFNTRFLRGLKPWGDSLELDDWPTFIRVFVAEAQLSAVVRFNAELTLCKYRIHSGGIHNQTERQLRVTEQVAKLAVPPKYRGTCLAKVRINNGLIHLYEGRWLRGAEICWRGFWGCPTPTIMAYVMRRFLKFSNKRLKIF